MTARATPWTPGPWKIDAQLGHHQTIMEDKPEHPATIGYVNPWDGYAAAEAKANARLIAEAPAMASVIRNLEILARHTAQLIEAGTVPGPQCAVDLHAEADTARALLARIGSV